MFLAPNVMHRRSIRTTIFMPKRARFRMNIYRYGERNRLLIYAVPTSKIEEHLRSDAVPHHQ